MPSFVAAGFKGDMELNSRPVTELRHFLWRARNLSSIMPWRSAVQLARRWQRSREVGFKLWPLERTVFVRPQSSDLSCVLEVFSDKGYDFPYELNPNIIIDAGANIGATSLYFTYKYPQAKIYAIEPDSSNFELLLRNCAGLDNIVCIQAGLWPEKTMLSFVDAAAEKWAISLKPAEVTDKAVTSITIPELMERFGIETINILKLDIEGAERELFSRGIEEWVECVDTIAIELHDRYKAGCAQAFYAALCGREFTQEQRGANIFIRLRH
jgi:FkbM family methyltransferase